MKRSLEVKNKVYYDKELLNYYCNSEQAKFEFESVREKYIQSIIQNVHKRCSKVDSDILSSLANVLDTFVVSII